MPANRLQRQQETNNDILQFYSNIDYIHAYTADEDCHYETLKRLLINPKYWAALERLLIEHNKPRKPKFPGTRCEQTSSTRTSTEANTGPWANGQKQADGHY